MSSWLKAANSTFLVLSSEEISEQVRAALRACAVALGHPHPPAFISTRGLTAEELGVRVHESDPWFVITIDVESLQALQKAFPDELTHLEADNPVTARGYTFVAVPGFSQCLGDQAGKRVAWERLKAAQYPGAPF